MPKPFPEPLSRDAYHGPAGAFVDLVLPATEADPAALLIQFLTTVGTAVGAGPRWTFGTSIHRLNLFVSLAAEAHHSRMGTSLGIVEDFFARACPSYVAPMCIARSHDFANAVLGDDEIVQETVLFVEDYLPGAVRALSREGSKSNARLCSAWQMGIGQVNSQIGPRHASVIGHGHADEIRKALAYADLFVGWLSRFLWVSVRRSKLIPRCVSAFPRSAAIEFDTMQAIGWAREDRDLELDFSPDAADVWREWYVRLSDPRPGLYGHITCRAAQQVLRLAGIYAVLDGTEDVGLPHLKAALEVYRYCDESAAWLFSRILDEPE